MDSWELTYIKQLIHGRNMAGYGCYICQLVDASAISTRYERMSLGWWQRMEGHSRHFQTHWQMRVSGVPKYIDRTGSTTDFCHLSGYHIPAMANQLLVVQVWSCRARWKRTFRLHLEPSLWPEPWPGLWWTLYLQGAWRLWESASMASRTQAWRVPIWPGGAWVGLNCFNHHPSFKQFFHPWNHWNCEGASHSASTWAAGRVDSSNLGHHGHRIPQSDSGAWFFCLALALGGFGNRLKQSWKMMKTDVDR